MRNHILCKASVILVALPAFMSSPRVTGCTKSSVAHECDQQFGRNENTDIGKSQRLLKEGNARINKVSAMRPGLAKIIHKVGISSIFECSDTDLHRAENGFCINYTDRWSSKWVHWHLKSQIPNCSTTHCEWENTLEFYPGVAEVMRLITRIHLREAWQSTIQRLPATEYNTGCMDSLSNASIPLVRYLVGVAAGTNTLQWVLPHVSNWSQLPGQSRVQFHMKPDRSNGSYQTKNPDHWKGAGFTTKTQHLKFTILAAIKYFSSDRITMQ